MNWKLISITFKLFSFKILATECVNQYLFSNQRYAANGSEMKEMKEQCFEMLLVIEMEIGYFTSLNGRHRPRLEFILLWEEEIV